LLLQRNVTNRGIGGYLQAASILKALENKLSFAGFVLSDRGEKCGGGRLAEPWRGCRELVRDLLP